MVTKTSGSTPSLTSTCLRLILGTAAERVNARTHTLATMALCMSTSASVAKVARPAVRASAEEKVRPRDSPARPVGASDAAPSASPDPFSRPFLPSPIGPDARRPPSPSPQPASVPRRVTKALAAAALSASIALAGPVSSANAEIRLPPLDPDPERCERAFVGNTIGQANAVSDRILDLRQCNYVDKDLSTKTLSGALMVDATFKGANMTEVVMSKAYALNADFTGANFTNAVVDRVTFDGANLSNANFYNAVITGATFEGTNLAGAQFEEALIGKEDVKRLCENPTLVQETRFQVGCRN